MNISLDFDGTYTEDNEAWNSFIDTFLNNGHQVYLVTMRYPHEANRAIKDLSKKIPVIFTERQAKKAFVENVVKIHTWKDETKEWITEENGSIQINVWIDDNPHWIYTDSI
ncbi:hypothetical protein [Burkholderia contaminans]|uniref:hypothetical protein n=1 Tax=Burkholderia contaminans TaxID=488447 RepID=UPI00158C73EA|nr:hypothetical protein [Burkholderia contaminans]